MAAASAGGGGPSTTTRQHIENFLTCSICMEPFRRPKILPCVHTFCHHCLRSYLATTVGSGGSRHASFRRKGGFPCPTCRQHVPVAKPSKAFETWPDQLKDNFVLSNMLEAINQQEESQHPPSSSPTTPTDHGGSSTTAESSSLTSCTCNSAPEVLCWSCASFVCGGCSVAKHAECSRVQKVSEAGPEQRQQMLDWLPHLNNDLSRLEGRHEMTSTLQLSLQARCQAANSHITQAANKAIQVVRAQEQRVRQAMEEEVEGLLKQHRQRQTANSRALQDVKALKTALEHCVTDTDLDLLRQAQCLKQRYVSVTEAVRTTAGDSEEEEDMDMGTFVPASSADLRSAVLVGTYHHYATVQSNTSPIPSPVVTSAVTSDSSTSCCQLEEGPVLHLETRSPSQPSAPPLSEHLLHESPLPLPESSLPEVTQESESTEAGPSTDDATSPSCSLSSPDLLSGHRGVTCHHASSFPAKVKGDRAEPLIRDMVVLSNGWLVATDTANRCVKRYFKTGPHDTKLHCKRLVLPHPPYGLCIVEGHLVAVTVPKERQLLLVMAMNHLVLSSTITLQEPAWAVGSLGEDRLAVTTCPHGEPGSVLILQMSGDSVQCVVRYSSQVSTPLYMAVTTDTHIVLTNPTSCQATCITSDTGHNVFHFHTSGKVMGVTCHSNVIALVDQSPALSLLTNQGRCLHTLILPKGKAGCSQPRAVAVATDSSVYVSDDGGRIHLFRFRWQQDPVTETSL